MGRQVVAVLALAASLSSGAACTVVPDPPPSGCGSEEDCAANEVCTIERKCRPTSSGPMPVSMASGTGGKAAAEPMPASMGGGTGGKAEVDAPSSAGAAGTAQPPAQTAGASGTATINPQPAGAGGSDNTPVKGLGASCAAASECQSQHCVDNVCCASACNGECRRCGWRGQCETVTEGSDLDTCSGDNTMCSPGGTCVSPIGAACQEDSRCLSARCFVGVSGGKCASFDIQIANQEARVDFGPDAKLRDVAQVITARATGELIELRLSIYCEDEGGEAYVGQIYRLQGDDSPTAGIAVARFGKLNAKRSASGAPWYHHPLDSNVPVKPGDRLGVMVSGKLGRCSIAGALGDVYADGVAYGSVDSKTWQPLNNDFALVSVVGVD